MKTRRIALPEILLSFINCETVIDYKSYGAYKFEILTVYEIKSLYFFGYIIRIIRSDRRNIQIKRKITITFFLYGYWLTF